MTVTRGLVTSPSVSSEVIEDGKIGYLRVSRFGDDTSAAARAEAVKLKEQGVSSILLDLRGNGGGYVSAARELSGLWLKGKVVATERRGGVVQQTFTTDQDATLAGIKTVILVDGGSASASEIVAAALSEHGAAKLVGTKTYGKGTMQIPEALRDGGTLKVTVAKWYTSKGVNVDKKGLSPDIVVEPGENELSTGQDAQKSAAIQELLK
jgi:carboxyl-terminal processing protease